jgi:hypothetical protein
VKVSYEYEEASVLEAWARLGSPKMTAARRRAAILLRSERARPGAFNRIAANPRNAASNVAIERRPLNVDSRPDCANTGHSPTA